MLTPHLILVLLLLYQIPELSTPSFSDSAFDPNEDASGHPNRSQTIAQGPDADELSPQESQSSLGNPDDVVADNSTGSDDTSAPPPTHTELVAKYFGVDPEKLLTSIHKRLEDRKTLVDIDDPDDVKLQNDIATYGAFDLAKGNGAKKNQFSHVAPNPYTRHQCCGH